MRSDREQETDSPRQTVLVVDDTPANIDVLVGMLAELRTRNRNAGVSTVLVNSRGRAWTPDGLNSSFNDARSKTECRKRIHDLRGTAVTEWCLAGMSDAEIAGAFGWSPARVAEIRRLYVDQARVVVSIGERLHREENRVKGTR